MIIRGAISIAVNSKVLWNLNLPDLDDANLFIVYLENEWHLLNKENTKRVLITNETSIWGIPRIIDNKIIQIFFYYNFLNSNTMYLDPYAVEALFEEDYYYLTENLELIDPYIGNSVHIITKTDGNPVGRDLDENIVAVSFYDS